MRVNGHTVPWSVLVLLGTIIAHGAVTFYKVDSNREAMLGHIALHAHPDADRRMILLEERVRAIQAELRAIKAMLENLSNPNEKR